MSNDLTLQQLAAKSQLLAAEFAASDLSADPAKRAQLQEQLRAAREASERADREGQQVGQVDRQTRPENAPLLAELDQASEPEALGIGPGQAATDPTPATAPEQPRPAEPTKPKAGEPEKKPATAPEQPRPAEPTKPKAGEPEKKPEQGRGWRMSRESFQRIGLDAGRRTYTTIVSRTMKDGYGRDVNVRPVDPVIAERLKQAAARQRAEIEAKRQAAQDKAQRRAAADRNMVNAVRGPHMGLAQRDYADIANGIRERDAYLAARIQHSGINHRLANNGEQLRGRLVGEKTINGQRHSIIEQPGRDGKPERVLIAGTLQGAALGKQVDMTVNRKLTYYPAELYAPAKHEHGRGRK